MPDGEPLFGFWFRALDTRRTLLLEVPLGAKSCSMIRMLFFYLHSTRSMARGDGLSAYLTLEDSRVDSGTLSQNYKV